MPTSDEIWEKTTEAQMAVLERIIRHAPTGASSSSIRDDAEAYAWLVVQNQPHGGSVSVKS